MEPPYAFVVMVIITFIASVDCRGYHHRKIRNMEKKMTRMAWNIIDLKNDVKMLKTLLMDKGIIAHETEELNSAKKKFTKAKDPTWIVKNPYAIAELSRKTVKKGFVRYLRFTIKLKFYNSTSLNNFHSYWTRETEFSSYQLDIPKIQATDQPIATTTVDVKPEDGSSLVFVFGHDEMWFTLRMDSAHSSTITMTNPELPEVHVKSKEVVYQPGGNATFQVLTSFDVKVPEDLRISDRFITYPEKDDFVLRDVDRPVASLDVQTHTNLPGIETDVTMDMSTPRSGVLTLSATKRFKGSSILQESQAHRRVAIFPSSQSGPFHEGFFAFQSEGREKDSSGNIKQKCMYGVKCPIHCVVVGSNETKLAIREFGKTVGLKTSVTKSSFQIAEEVHSFTQGSSARFVCEATNQLGQQLFQNMMSDPFLPSTIMSVGWRNLYLDSKSSKKIRILCTAKGIPLPQLTMRVRSLSQIMSFESDELDVVPESDSPHTVVAFRTLTIPHSFYDLDGNLHVDCIAENLYRKVEKSMSNIYVHD